MVDKKQIDIKKFNEIKDKYDIDPLKEIFYKLKEKNDIYFAAALRNNVTMQFFQFLKRNIDRNENIILNISGRTRSSKSSDAEIIDMWIYAYCNHVKKHSRPYDVRKVTIFNISQMINLFDAKAEGDKAEFHDCFIIDEKKAYEAIQYGSMYEQGQLKDIDRIAAKKCIHRINIIGSMDDIDNTAFYQLVTYGKNFKTFTNKLLVYTREENERVPLGYIEIPVSEWLCSYIKEWKVTDCIVCPLYSKENFNEYKNDTWAKEFKQCSLTKAVYERMKDENIDKTTGGGLEERTKLKIKLSYQFYKDPIFKAIKVKTRRKIYIQDNYFKYTNRRFTIQEIDEIADRVELIEQIGLIDNNPGTLDFYMGDDSGN